MIFYAYLFISILSGGFAEFSKKYKTNLLMMHSQSGLSVLCGYNKRGEKAFIPINNFVEMEKVPRFMRATVYSEKSSMYKLKKLFRYVSSLENRSDGFEFWQYPKETVKKRSGDCEDKAFLMYALCLKAEIKVVLVFGEIMIKGSPYAHVWITFEGQVVDSTLKNFYASRHHKYYMTISLRKK